MARLAGLPAEVIERARAVLLQHEQSEHRLTDQLSPGAEPPTALQFTLFTPVNNAVIERLAQADLDAMTPLDALNLLAELKKRIEEG